MREKKIRGWPPEEYM